MTRSLIFGSQALCDSTINPGPENSRKPPSGIWTMVNSGSEGSAPNKSENTFTERAMELAKSSGLAEAERGAKTFTFTPSACFALSCSGPATNEPLGAAFGHSKTYKSRPPSAADFAATRDGESDLPVPATANVSGTVKRNVPVYRFVG